MLSALSIRNIVLIDACDLEFGPGLVVLTGETGAGKSILLDALGLVLGGRGESRLVRSGETQGSVSATFEVEQNKQPSSALESLGIEASGTLILRRTLSTDGKTRCFINDTPVGVGALREIGDLLLETHGQHDSKGLLDPSSHLLLLDGYAKLDGARKKLSSLYAAWKDAEATLSHARVEQDAAAKEEEFLRHGVAELRALAPEPGEEEILSEKRTRMMQGEKLSQVIGEALRTLQGEPAISERLRQTDRLLERSSFNKDGIFNAAITPLEHASDAVARAESALEAMLEDTRYDPGVLEKVDDRLFALKDASRKYRVEVSALPTVLREMESKLSLVESGSTHVKQLEEACAKARDAYIKAAATISGSRKKAAGKLEKDILAELAPLKMEKTRVRIGIETLAEPAWSPNGIDRVHFEASTNAGSDFAPLHKIASGGELARFMLAVKVITHGSGNVGTLIFDEIDTGTGGAVADAIGQRLAALGKHTQVMVVTHLPQVAAQGDQHFMVEKKESRGRTTTLARALGEPERHEELARMLAGAEITPEARSAAARLLKRAG